MSRRRDQSFDILKTEECENNSIFMHEGQNVTSSLSRDEIVRAKFANQRRAEAAGQVADSLDVRMAIVARVNSGEISLESAQKELKNIKRNAKKNGKITRNQAFSL
jgi:hypothetical protein